MATQPAPENHQRLSGDQAGCHTSPSNHQSPSGLCRRPDSDGRTGTPCPRTRANMDSRPARSCSTVPAVTGAGLPADRPTLARRHSRDRDQASR